MTSLCRNMDLFMFSMRNIQDRSVEAWSKIVKAADPRLRVASIGKPTESHDAIIEIVRATQIASFKKRNGNMRPRFVRIAFLGS